MKPYKRPVPWQLQTARRPKRTERRPIAEQMSSINVTDLSRAGAFPPNWFDRNHLSNIGFRWTQLRHVTLSRALIEFTLLSGHKQSIRVKWIRTGFGTARPSFICPCGRAVIRLYCHRGKLSCRRCCNAIYASQVCSKQLRLYLQARRLRSFLRNYGSIGSALTKPRGSKMYGRTFQRLKGRCQVLESKISTSRRLTSRRIDERILRPQSNYRTRITPHWR
jgi:hypothetical protein